MGTTLTGTTPQDTYDSLIKVGDNGPIGASAKTLSDGLGNDLPISVSTSAVAIGTLNVGYGTFGVYNASNSLLGIANSTSYAQLQQNGSDLYVNTNLGGAAGGNLIFRFGSGSTEHARITSAGNVGIGTSSPASRLVVVSDDPSQVSIEASTGNVNSQINLKPSGTGIAYIKNQANTDFAFGTNNTERMRITSAGNVGIGRTPFEASGFRSLDIDGTNGSLFLLRTSGTTNLSIGTSSGNPTIKAEAGKSLNFYTDATQVANITPNGITFGADTAAANALDDYEEGTWTMGISFNNGSTGVTYGVNTGAYTKIGRQVTVNGYLTLSNKGSSTGTARITGLPFTIASGDSNYAGVTFAELAFITRTGDISGYGNVGLTNIFLLETSTSGVISALTDSNFANNSTIMVSFTYFV